MKVIDSSMLNFVSGAGNYADNRGDSKNKGRGASTNYGGQANGFVGNTAAAGQGLGQGSCSNIVAGGMIAGSYGGPISMGLGAIGGLVGGCIDSKGGGNSQSGGNSNCNSGSSCSW
ncbi:Uncharacterised protein [Serratia fonticola]|uniref:hypothetical protein n=1 Tax=Serratia fonticola TaxID=47917 RepID=UPI002177E31E|nr:hypothetical protein [Serratia fonticola]CAI2046386.1 Uncharacterised protein [Serratia fonticola]